MPFTRPRSRCSLGSARNVSLQSTTSTPADGLHGAVIEWTDETPSTDAILDIVTAWWLTDTFPYSIYRYRESTRLDPVGLD